MVSGYRIKRKDKILRRILTYVYSLTINVIFQINYRDYDCGFKIFNRKKLLKVLKSNSFEKNLITSQIFLYFIINKYRINQYPIIYKEKKTRNSRGIPTKKILNVVLTAILNLIKIRLNFKL